MRSLSSPTLTATVQTITEPRWFLELGFSTTIRLSANGAMTWNALSWADGAFTVSGLTWGNSIDQSVSINFDDADNVIAAFVLNEEIADRTCKLWIFDAKATATGDPVLVFDGVCDSANGGNGGLKLAAKRLNSKTVEIPRGTYSTTLPAELFAPAGTVIQWGNGTIVLNPRSELA